MLQDRKDSSLITIPGLDRRLREIGPLISQAGNSLLSFFNESLGVFHRDTVQIDAADTKVHPTSTSRAFYALHEYLRFLFEEGDQDGDTAKRVKTTLEAVVEKYLSQLPATPDFVRSSSSNGTNMFTDSHLLLAVGAIKSLARLWTLKTDVHAVNAAAETIASDNLANLKTWKGGKIKPTDEVHDFVTLHAVRALDVHGRFESADGGAVRVALANRVKEDALRLLAYDAAGVSSKFDPTELVFSISLLNRFPTPDTPQLTDAALKTIIKNQAPDGSWPTARIVTYQGQGLLHVASYEVALALADFLVRQIQTGVGAVPDLVRSLDRAVSLAQSAFNVDGPISGWANDHTRRVGLIESWTTAIVLTFLIHYRDALIAARQLLIVRRYGGQLPQQARMAWPDTIQLFRSSHVPAVKGFSKVDPTDDGRLASETTNQLLTPVLQNWIHRPERASLILFGPPGSRKTSFAKLIAQAFEWPLVILSPTDFLRPGGLEGFESAAAKIFSDLMKLRRAVVLLDECEDFFKKRPRDAQLESRTVGAFITAGMLPRLQALHDQRWIVFIVATNSELEELDPAVYRRGRFDFAQKIDYPTLAAQERYFTERADALKLSPAIRDVGLTVLKDARGTQISFSVLDEYSQFLTAGGTKDAVTAELKRLTESMKPRPLA